MAKVENKTKKTNASVKAFIENIANEQMQKDCETIDSLMEKIVGEPGAMWGKSIVGYGNYHLKYESGRELDWMYVGFSPRKKNLTLYIMDGFDKYDEFLGELGRHSTGKSCLYIKKLADIDLSVLEKLITASVKHIKKTST